MISKDKTRITITLDEDFINILTILCKQSDKSRSKVIKDALAILYLVARGKARIYQEDEGKEEENNA